MKQRQPPRLRIRSLLVLTPAFLPLLFRNDFEPSGGGWQVANEIEERQQFLLEARESGVPRDSETEARIMGEISLRMGELKRLTPSG